MPDIHRLIEQLSAPLERPSWPQSAGPPLSKVLVLPDDDSSFALVVWVKRTANGITLLSATSTAAPIGLQRLATEPGRQLLGVGAQPRGATHLLVMGWTRQRRAAPPWTRRLFDHPLDPFPAALEVLSPSIASNVLQDALNEVLRHSPDAIESSLLVLPAPVSPAMRTLAGAPQEYTFRTGLATHIHETAQTDLQAHMLPSDAPERPPLRATRLIFASCQYPAGLLDHRAASASFRRMQDTAGSEPALGALLLLGDQIYADATYGILDPSGTSDRFVLLYNDLRQSLDQYRLIADMSKEAKPRLYVTPDDHEIRDNWEPGGHHRNGSDMRVALEAFERLGLSRLPAKQALGGYWGTVDVGGGHEAFMLDTRTTRDPRPWGPGSGGDAPHIVNQPQRDALERWLRERQREDGTGPVSPKFISSSVWLLPRRVGRADGPDGAAARSDSWDGYPESLHWLLGFIAVQAIRGVVLLCGDAHLAGHTRVALKHQAQTVLLHILHAPALYAPFPFANGQSHDYRCQDQWDWSSGSVSSHVESELWALGDGFVHLSVVFDGGAWHIRATFDAGPNHGRSDFWTVN